MKRNRLRTNFEVLSLTLVLTGALLWFGYLRPTINDSGPEMHPLTVSQVVAALMHNRSAYIGKTILIQGEGGGYLPGDVYTHVRGSAYSHGWGIDMSNPVNNADLGKNGSRFADLPVAVSFNQGLQVAKAYKLYVRSGVYKKNWNNALADFMVTVQAMQDKPATCVQYRSPIDPTPNTRCWGFTLVALVTPTM